MLGKIKYNIKLPEVDKHLQVYFLNNLQHDLDIKLDKHHFLNIVVKNYDKEIFQQDDV